ncbi:MAG: hypothetical protein LQ350_000645 [Teloschistes chrysophthalmus]|nr:MAG: hypothetical protein LQ350_000645 [Niorma chrysophthalma]
MQDINCSKSCNPSNALTAVPCQKYHNYHHHAETLKNVKGVCNRCAREDEGISTLLRSISPPSELQTRSGAYDLSDLFSPEPNRHGENDVTVPPISEVESSKGTATQQHVSPDKLQVMVNLPGMPAAIPCLQQNKPAEIASSAGPVPSVPSSMDDTQDGKHSMTFAPEQKKKKRISESSYEQKKNERREDYRKAQAALLAHFSASGITLDFPSLPEDEDVSSSLKDTNDSSPASADFTHDVSDEHIDSPSEAKEETPAPEASNEATTSSILAMPVETDRAGLSLPQINGYLKEMDDQYTKLQSFTSKLREDASSQEARTSSTLVDTASTSPSMAEIALETFRPTNLRRVVDQRSASSQMRQPLDAQTMSALLDTAKSNWLSVCETIMGSANPHDGEILKQMSHLVSCLGTEHNFPDLVGDSNKDDGTTTSNKDSDQRAPMEQPEIEKLHRSERDEVFGDEPLSREKDYEGVFSQAVNGVMEAPVEAADKSINDANPDVSIQEDNEQLFARRERIASSLWILRKGQPIEAGSGEYVSQHNIPGNQTDVNAPTVDDSATSNINYEDPKDPLDEEISVHDDASQLASSDVMSVIDEVPPVSPIEPCSKSLSPLEQEHEEGEPGLLNCRKRRNGDRAAEGGKINERIYDDQPPTSIGADADDPEPSYSTKNFDAQQQQAAKIVDMQQLDALIDAAFPKEEDTWTITNEEKPLHSFATIETKEAQPQKYVIPQKRWEMEHASAVKTEDESIIPQKRWEMEEASVVKTEDESMSTLDIGEPWRSAAFKAASLDLQSRRLKEHKASLVVGREEPNISSEHHGLEPCSGSWQGQTEWGEEVPMMPSSAEVLEEPETSVKEMNGSSDLAGVSALAATLREQSKKKAEEAASAADKHFMQMVEERVAAIVRSDETEWETDSNESEGGFHESHSVGAGVEEEKKDGETQAPSKTQQPRPKEKKSVFEDIETIVDEDEAQEEALEVDTKAKSTPSRVSSLFHNFGFW